MTEKNQNSENDEEVTEKREKAILVRLTQSEKNEIHKFAKKIHLTDSEFCRVAIWDKIRHLKNPELYSQFPNQPYLDEETIKQIKKGFKVIEDIKNLDEKFSTILHFIEKQSKETKFDPENVEIIRSILSTKDKNGQTGRTMEVLLEEATKMGLDHALIQDITIKSGLFKYSKRRWFAK